MQPPDVKMPMTVTIKQEFERTPVASSGFSGETLTDLVIGSNPLRGEERRWKIQEASSCIYSLVSYDEPNPIKLDNLESLSDSSILDSEFITSLTENNEDMDELIFSGVQELEYPRKVVFSEEIEVKTSELKKRPPQIIIEPYLLEDDE